MNPNAQLALLEVEDDLSLPDERVSAAFTGEQLDRRHQLREAITLLLSAGVPVDVIARRVGVSNHTVMVLRDRAFEAIAEQKKEFAQVCLSKGAKFLGLAEALASSAGFKDLMIGFGIATQRGQELLAMGSAAEDAPAKVIDVDAARMRLDRILVSSCDGSLESPSSVSPGIGVESGHPAAGSASPGTVPPASPAADPDAAAGQGAGGGAGSAAGSGDDVSAQTEVSGKGA